MGKAWPLLVVFQNRVQEVQPWAMYIIIGTHKLKVLNGTTFFHFQVPEPVLPPWVTSPAASSASTPAGAGASGSTEHVYAMPARVIGTSGESLEHDPRSVGSLVSLDSSSATPGRESSFK